MELKELRVELDRLDRELVRLYERRLELCSEVAAEKLKTGRAVLDSEREQQKLDSVAMLVGNDFDKKAVRELYSQIMTVSRRLQLGILREQGHDEELFSGYVRTESLDRKARRVVYQGVEGAYAHIAAMRIFGEDGDISPVATWREGMDRVSRGAADSMVLPIENSSHGVVYDNLDLLLEYPELSILEETDISVEHALMACEGADMQSIRRIFSHPQALGQCSLFLRAHPEIEAVPVLNTALAAKTVAESGDKSLGALASEVSAEIYGLSILKRRVNQESSNTTRFLVLGREKVYTENASKVSICFELAHRPGALYNILGNFRFNDVNMRMIQSRPVPDRPFDYRFFVDIEGSLSDESIKNALNGIRQETTMLRILGCY